MLQDLAEKLAAEVVAFSMFKWGDGGTLPGGILKLMISDPEAGFAELERWEKDQSKELTRAQDIVQFLIESLEEEVLNPLRIAKKLKMIDRAYDLLAAAKFVKVANIAKSAERIKSVVSKIKKTLRRDGEFKRFKDATDAMEELDGETRAVFDSYIEAAREGFNHADRLGKLQSVAAYLLAFKMLRDRAGELRWWAMAIENYRECVWLIRESMKAPTPAGGRNEKNRPRKPKWDGAWELFVRA